MKLFTKITQITILASTLGFVGNVAAEEMNLDSLLRTLEEGKKQQSAQNKQREQAFAAREGEQVQMLKDTQENRNQMLVESERLETEFEQNEIKLANLTDTLSKRMGSLKELFGVLQQVAGDSSNKFATSVVSAQIPGRGQFM
ncbi:MAG: energy transducer TonB, partial [Pseudoalteromonas sp.]